MNESDIQELARYGVATVYEAAGRTGLIDIPLLQLIPGSRVAGRARTVRCGQGDNLMVHAVMEQVQPGEILILTMPEPEPVALIGELLATQALARQVAGILVDASVRDTEELQALGLPPGTGRNSTQPCDRRLLDWPPKLPLQDWMGSSSGTISWNCSLLPICLRSPSFMASGSPVDSGPRASLRIKGMVSHPLLLLARGFSVPWRRATPWMPIANLPARRASRASCSHP
jgi:Aldolase/RraA